jgi:hypothetical protein
MSVISRTGTLPDSANKADFYAIIDSSTVGSIENADIAAGAAIVDTKLATISTAGKVNGASLTGLSSIPSGAGVIPASNLPTALEKASQAEAEAGTDDAKYTTPLKVAQAITALASGLQVKVASFTRDMTAATGDVAITGVGFTPKAIVFLGTRNGISVGFADASAQGYSSLYGTSPVGSDYGTSWVIDLDVDGTNAQRGALKSLDADGFTMTWTKAGSPTGTGYCKYLAIG